MSHPSKSALPQVAYGDGPEVFNPYPQQLEPQHVQAISSPEPAKSPKILGLRRQTFWLSLILIAVVIATAVGGGVGGSLAVRNAKLVLSKPTAGERE
jgi:hypothetical protein